MTIGSQEKCFFFHRLIKHNEKKNGMNLNNNLLTSIGKKVLQIFQIEIKHIFQKILRKKN